ncbi:MAG: hypothetical protein UT48_C0005G0011 [Parcubacteria group bacterium GW2011_GWE2_39_37]|uniref:F0F1-ATPase subunit n=1 Tax=Candidatus Falkowbacteria bacterium GW2011_GWF2_39_8 TaxID=1618642 RepID=A0A0G0Q6H5_9BACT|nr:MAG: hypothetical protein UT48_C0005G0011 [Parcubacteria group bacterium GW2011_GWE2_39_37]KKR32951.1 MAG: hypothetical protein UT64_C0018G0014 [Candidatus Falkowbacteria bacterium GW2011_GWF2_39_8]
MKKTENSDQTPWWQPSLILFTKLSAWIGTPVIIAVFVGKYLDKQFNTEPWLFLSCVGVAFVFSMFALIYIGMNEMRKIDEQEKKEDRSKK